MNKTDKIDFHVCKLGVSQADKQKAFALVQQKLAGFKPSEMQSLLLCLELEGAYYMVGAGKLDDLEVDLSELQQYLIEMKAQIDKEDSKQ